MRRLKIFKAVVSGQTYSQAGVPYGLSADRVSQIVAQWARGLLTPERLGDDVCPHQGRKVYDLRRHSDFWLAQVAKIESKIGK